MYTSWALQSEDSLKIEGTSDGYFHRTRFVWKVQAALGLKSADERAGEISQAAVRVMAQPPVRGTTRQVTAPHISRWQKNGCPGKDINNAHGFPTQKISYKFILHRTAIIAGDRLKECLWKALKQRETVSKESSDIWENLILAGIGDASKSKKIFF